MPDANDQIEPTDADLVARALAGHRDAFNRLVLRHQRRLFRFLCKAAGGRVADAEDAMQQALVKSYVHLAKYDARWRFTTWLFAIALREFRTLHRRRRPAVRPAGDDASPEPAARPEPQPDLGDGPGETWDTARRVLTEPQYTALWLRYGEDLQAREIAKVMNRPRVWVSVTLHRACATLRQFTGGGDGAGATAAASARARAASSEASKGNPIAGGTL